MPEARSFELRGLALSGEGACFLARAVFRPQQGCGEGSTGVWGREYVLGLVVDREL